MSVGRSAHVTYMSPVPAYWSSILQVGEIFSTVLLEQYLSRMFALEAQGLQLLPSNLVALLSLGLYFLIQGEDSLQRSFLVWLWDFFFFVEVDFAYQKDVFASDEIGATLGVGVDRVRGRDEVAFDCVGEDEICFWSKGA